MVTPLGLDVMKYACSFPFAAALRNAVFVLAGVNPRSKAGLSLVV
jgi:hypothetical protein